METTNLKMAFASFQDAWRPQVAGYVNDVQVRLAKFRGEFLWHYHEHEDELFFVHKGELVMRFRDRDVMVNEGEFIIVPRGVEHMPVSKSPECEIVTVSPKTLRNTGNVENERTVHELGRIATRNS